MDINDKISFSHNKEYLSINADFELFDKVIFENEDNRNISQSELFSFINKYFHEIKDKFDDCLLKLFYAKDNQILEFWNPYFTIKEQDLDIKTNNQIKLLIDLPSLDELKSIYIFSVYKIWNKHKSKKIINIYIKVDIHAFDKVTFQKYEILGLE